MIAEELSQGEIVYLCSLQALPEVFGQLGGLLEDVLAILDGDLPLCPGRQLEAGQLLCGALDL